MEIILSAEESMLRDTIARYVEREYSFASRRQRIAMPDGFSRDTWRALAELGVLGATLSADDGGFGAGAMGTLVIAQELGRGLVVEPYFATVVLGAGVLQLAAAGERRQLLGQVAAGEVLLALAHGEPDSRYEPTSVATRATVTPAGFSLTGSKSVVIHGAAADQLIVSARTSGATADADGISLFLVERRDPALRIRCYPTVDGLRAADIAFDGLAIPHAALLGELGDAGPIIEHVLDRANAALCAEATGAMQSLFDRTVSYLRTRQQFGLPLARFQALQHRVADMAMHVEQARSMAYLAALHADGTDAAARGRMISAAKARICTAANFVGKQAVQLHGGVGMTDALDVSHYFRRLMTIERTLGDADYHVRRFSEANAQDELARRGQGR